MDEHVGLGRNLAVFGFQVAVGALVLSSFVHSGVGDLQPGAEEPGSAAVADSEARAGRRRRPAQVLPAPEEDHR